MFRKWNLFSARRVLAATVISAAFAVPAVAVADDPPAPTHPGMIFYAPLADVPGTQLVVVELNIPPRGTTRPNAAPREGSDRPVVGHRHPGSVYVHVTDGTLHLGLEGEPVQVVSEGGSFFEPPGVLHTVIENASSSEAAHAIAVMIVPDGEPILTPVYAETQAQP